MMRRRAGESADGLALMTSSVTSSYSADGMSEQSQESAVPVQARRRKTHVYVVSHTAAAVCAFEESRSSHSCWLWDWVCTRSCKIKSSSGAFRGGRRGDVGC
ncbi:hypothetical protein F511_35637 [Dorcoceras hygrometricum]|uniref:Uncharacterized protein n=1 Tax=Dorcoceras hygrometricum TaxID=472368 RepID=A0A2Z7CKJ1_9LAMI|nr:hypothetical protein F511_35637 [Dorcoceras hygrometricum]